MNPSGGLACFGEAVPAQAIAQVCEVTWQLRGQATGRQVEGATAGITANQGLFGHGSSVLLRPAERPLDRLHGRPVGGSVLALGDLAVGVVELDVELELRQVHEPELAEGALVDVAHAQIFARGPDAAPPRPAPGRRAGRSVVRPASRLSS